MRLVQLTRILLNGERSDAGAVAIRDPCSHSGKLLSDIKIPEVISLCVRIRQVRFGHSKNTLLDVRATRGCIAKFFPVTKPAASNHVVYCSKGPLIMVQVTVQHAIDYSSLMIYAPSTESTIVVTRRSSAAAGSLHLPV